MAWPRRIYVATTALGVYYTENFVDPGTQPTWTAVNTGLPTLDCKEFWLDPFDPAARQYVMLSTDRTLYRRENGGAWTSILTPAQMLVVVGADPAHYGTNHWFCADSSVPGRIWVQCQQQDGGWVNAVWSIWSDDYGATWSRSAVTPYGGFALYGCYGIRARGDNVYMAVSAWAGGSGTIFGSSDKGAAWSTEHVWGWNAAANPMLNPLTPNGVYSGDQGGYLSWCPVGGGGRTQLQAINDGLGRRDVMWFDPVDADHQRQLQGGTLYATTDSWSSIDTTTGGIAYTPYMIAPWAGADTDQILTGLTLVGGTPPTQPHVIGALHGDSDTTPDRIAGASPGTAPYTDSIPYTCGGLALNGIQAIEAVGIIHTYAVAMPGYTDAERGTPMEGDRASWETGDTHSDDWDTGDSHHAAATIGADAGELLELDGQEIQFVVQAANTFLAGPASGVDADPTFRAVVSDDLPAHTHVEADITDLDHTDADAIHDNVAGEIHAITEKASPVAADEIVIEDSAGGGWTKKRVSIASLLAGTGAVIPLFSQVVDVDVENTADATSVLGSGRGSKTISANEIDQGTVIVIVGHGYLSTTGEPTLKIAVTLGGSEVCATEVFTAADTITDQGFTFRAEIVCRSTGATGSVVAGGTFEYDAGNQHKLLKTSATAIDTTGTLEVDVTATWGTASASNTLTCQVAAIELIKADDLAVAAPGGLTAVEV